jgi:hypothetical protein
LNFEDGINYISNFPAALSDLDTSKTFFIYQSFKTTYTGGNFRYMLRKVIGQSLTGEYLEYAQFCGINYSESSGKVVSQTEWVKLSGNGGAAIASGTVNDDGTITFYDKDGNPLFTTTGKSVIGPQGPQGVQGDTGPQGPQGETGATGPQGIPGNDYVLTAQDKDEIADIVLAEFTGSIVNGELNTR